MNKEILLNYMLWHVQMYADSVNEDLSQDPDSAASNVDELHPADEELNTQILRLYNRRENACKYPPSSLPKSPKEMISVLRDYYKDDVTKISLVLHHYFPDQFVFYRVSRLDDEVFRGFEFFSDIIPDFDFDFERVRRNGFEQYLRVNQALLAVAKGWWPDAVNIQYRIERFLYDSLAPMFLTPNDYNQYWVVNTQHEYWVNRHPSDVDGEPGAVAWSGRKEMRAGDLVFMYGSDPVKAITDVYMSQSHAWFDPYGGWDGSYVDLEHLCELPESISFAEMRKDPALGRWSVIRR